MFHSKYRTPLAVHCKLEPLWTSARTIFSRILLGWRRCETARRTRNKASLSKAGFKVSPDIYHFLPPLSTMDYVNMCLYPNMWKLMGWRLLSRREDFCRYWYDVSSRKVCILGHVLLKRSKVIVILIKFPYVLHHLHWLLMTPYKAFNIANVQANSQLRCARCWVWHDLKIIKICFTWIT